MSSRTTPRLFFSDVRGELARKPETNSGLRIAKVTSASKFNDKHNNTGNALWTFNGNEYGAYYNNDSPNVIVLTKRAITSDVITSATLTKELVSFDQDSHGAIAIAVDSNGFIHVWYDMHGSDLNYFKMPTAESIAGTPGANISMVGTNENDVTYPLPFADKDGELFFRFRDGGSDDADWYYYKYDVGTTAWSSAPGLTAGLMFNGKVATVNPYNGAPFIDSNNNALISFVWRDTAASTTNHDLSFVRYNLTTGVATQADGTSQTLPVTLANCEIIDATASGTGLNTSVGARNCSLLSDSSILVAYQKFDANSQIQNWYIKFDGTSWGSPVQLTDGDGVERDNQIVCLLKAINSDVVYYIYRSLVEGDVLSCLESRDRGATWSNYAVSSQNMGTWDARNINVRQWDLTELFVTCFSVFSSHVAESINLSKGYYRLEWAPSDGARSCHVVAPSLLSYEDIHIKSETGHVIIDIPEDNKDQKLVINSSDGNMKIGNSTSLEAKYQPSIESLSKSSDRGHQRIARILVADDSGTFPVYMIDARQDDETDITTRPLFGIRNNATINQQSLVNGDFEVATDGQGIVLNSPNGTAYRITVDNAGAVVSTAV